ncbi:2-dehydropantoate 2-reductase [Nocardioides sp.]|uniref:2-dehydropantoate 2-reductase n=1 Tax=Nocardioides sp. TaxID=35761 RepID=UPI00271FDF90|nr:2-dehydropantoate 2-reductase [Nocardioides sp.]MDO9455349.1 2-dehydropantoate 2-reductase [Nocardioides sp.]
MRITIYGAGAIGGWVGAAIARAGETPGVVARGATLEALRRDGLTVRRGDEAQVVPVHAAEDPAELGVQDVVVVAVKAPSLAGVAGRIAPLLGPGTTVLTAMNGISWWFLEGGFGGPLAGTRLETVDPDGAIAAAIPAHHVVGGVAHVSCSVEAPGVVRHHLGNGLILGEPSGGTSTRTTELAALLERGGIDASVSTRIQRDVWFKLWGNMTVNPISALTGATTDAIMDDDLVRGFVSAVMLEAQAIGARIGVPIEESPENRHQVTRRLGAFRTSMLQDVDAGRPVELDALVGVVRELGQACGVATPCTDALLGLSRLQARRLGLYPG